MYSPIIYLYIYCIMCSPPKIKSAITICLMNIKTEVSGFYPRVKVLISCEPAL